MKRKYNRGMSIVEILISICIISIVLALLFTLLIQVRHEDTDNNIQSNFIINQSTYIKTIEEDIVNYGIKSVENCTLADANIREDTVAKGQQDNIKCIKIVYAADYLKDNIGFIFVYNHYRSYDVENGNYNYAMSILKSNHGNPAGCNRYTFAYENPSAGEGHFIHTYMHDGNPLPSFEGEPKLVEIDGEIDEFAKMVWENLNEENKVSLFVRFIEIESGKYETRIINKHQ